MSALDASFISIMVRVAGQAMAMSTTSGTMVQITSTVVFSWNCAALAPTLLRCLKMDQNIAPNTTKKITMQTYMIPQWRSYASCAVGEWGGRMSTSHVASAGREARSSEAAMAAGARRRFRSILRTFVVSFRKILLRGDHEPPAQFAREPAPFRVGHHPAQRHPASRVCELQRASASRDSHHHPGPGPVGDVAKAFAGTPSLDHDLVLSHLEPLVIRVVQLHDMESDSEEDDLEAREGHHRPRADRRGESRYAERRGGDRRERPAPPGGTQ